MLNVVTAYVVLFLVLSVAKPIYLSVIIISMDNSSFCNAALTRINGKNTQH